MDQFTLLWKDKIQCFENKYIRLFRKVENLKPSFHYVCLKTSWFKSTPELQR